jgi:tRNA U34 5-carboxymethylaminomethyl modifying GTPase MnmE/TrmE
VPKILVRTKTDIIENPEVRIEQLSKDISVSNCQELSSASYQSVEELQEEIQCIVMKPERGLEKDVIDQLKNEEKNQKAKQNTKLAVGFGAAALSLSLGVFLMRNTKAFKFVKELF